VYVFGTIAAAGLAHFLFQVGYPNLIYDSWGYYVLAGILRDQGPSHWPLFMAELRTYGYPLFLALVTGWRSVAAETHRAIVFHVQLILFLIACGWIGRSLAKTCGSPTAGLVGYFAGALNIFLLAHATEPLSDLLSAVLVGVAVALSWKVPGNSGRFGSSARAFLAFSAAGLAAMVRPVNAVVVAALLVVWLWRGILFRDVPPVAVGAMLLGLLLTLAPQMALNYAVFKRPHPLIVKSLYSEQTEWGMSALKYATDVRPGKPPGIDYVNPLFHGERTPVDFLRKRPIAYAATLGLHGFAMMDHDFLFTYITEARPWYRWPAAILNYLLLYGAGLGGILAVRRWRTVGKIDEVSFLFLSTAVTAAAYWAIHLPVKVENRFALPLDLLAVPFIAFGAMSAARSMRGPGARSRVLALLVSAALFVGACASLSSWLTRQAPGLRQDAAPRAGSLDRDLYRSGNYGYRLLRFRFARFSLPAGNLPSRFSVARREPCVPEELE
jgi:hypothetical protein